MTADAGSPAERRRLTLEAFTKKVETLEAWLLSGLPEGETYPRTQKALRLWRGPEFSETPEHERPAPLRTWSDPMIERPVVGKYPHLANRFIEAVRGLDQRVEENIGELARAEVALKASEAKRRDQLVQIAELLSRLAEAERERDFWKDLASARQKKP